MNFGIFRRKQRRAIDRIEFSTLIGAGTLYRGDFTGSDHYIVYGQVEGSSEIDGHIVLGATGRWTGTISARHVVIAGEVVGDVIAGEKLELKETARIRGNITAPVIAMAEGALYDGEIRMRPRPQLVHFNEKRSV